jgi:mannose-1-phosphate guanylyltransferase
VGPVKAVVLVGGEGTRLRPLTETIPKPLIPLMDRRFLDKVLDHLVRHGVDEVIMSSPYLEETFAPFIASRRGRPRITWITEETALGTGGAIVNALDHVGPEPFLALNGDILTDLDLTGMLAFHRERGAAATIALTRVEDARPFGLVPTEDDGRVIEFREKPAELVPGEVNAGTYVLDPAALAGWPSGRAISIELEIFPALIQFGRPVYGYLSHGYWMDLGTPEKYLQAHVDILERRVEGERYPAPFIVDGASVHPRASLGPSVVVGRGATIAEEAEVQHSVIHPGAVIEVRARVVGCILGPGARVGAGASVRSCVLAEGAEVPPGLVLEGERISAGDTAGGTAADSGGDSSG